MIPENKQTAVKKALQTAFQLETFTDIEPLTKGLSGALIFKITVHEKPYLLRVVTRTDAFGDPSFYYGCMQVAADHDIAPKIHYLSTEDRLSITDFIMEQPFPLPTAKALMPSLLRKMHALPKFPQRNNYFEAMEQFIPRLRSSGIISGVDVEAIANIYDGIARVYPRQDVANWVSAHNDSKPDNVVFDGQRPWFVDWESAFLNDRYLDLAIVANFLVTNQQEEISYLENYFESPVSEYQSARFFLMQEMLHLFYFLFLMAFDQGEHPIAMEKITKRGFQAFHEGMWRGDISLVEAALKREYALIHLEQFQLKAQSDRFRESLNILSKDH